MKILFISYFLSYHNACDKIMTDLPILLIKYSFLSSGYSQSASLLPHKRRMSNPTHNALRIGRFGIARSAYFRIYFYFFITLLSVAPFFNKVKSLFPILFYYIFYSTAFLAYVVSTNSSYGTRFSSSPASSKISCKSVNESSSKIKSFFHVSCS